MDDRVKERYAIGELGQRAMDLLRAVEKNGAGYDRYSHATVLALLAIVAELRRLPG